MKWVERIAVLENNSRKTQSPNFNQLNDKPTYIGKTKYKHWNIYESDLRDNTNEGKAEGHPYNTKYSKLQNLNLNRSLSYYQ